MGSRSTPAIIADTRSHIDHLAALANWEELRQLAHALLNDLDQLEQTLAAAFLLAEAGLLDATRYTLTGIADARWPATVDDDGGEDG